MSITIYIHLLNGDVLEHRCRGRNGSVKFATAKASVNMAVLKHLGVSHETHEVVLSHMDDEECMMALRRTEVDKWNRVYGRPAAKEEDYDLSRVDETNLNRLREKLEKQRSYTEGTVVYALVKEKIRWEDVDWEDHDSDFE